MKKYIVKGSVTVEVSKEVWAYNEEDAIDKARDQLSILTAYCGNGGCDKLVGVDGDGESVDIYEDIDYESAEEIEDDPDYFECPNCGEQCEKRDDEYGVYYWCDECEFAYDEDGDEVELVDEEDDEE